MRKCKAVFAGLIIGGVILGAQGISAGESPNAAEQSLMSLLTPTPTPKPTATPTPKPTATPTPKPTATPTPKTTATPTPKPTATPAPKPTATPTPRPTATSVPEPLLSEETLRDVINQMAEGEGFQTLNTDYELPEKSRTRLEKSVNAILDKGQQLSFAMVDMKSGAAFFYRPERSLFSASTIKGPYIASVVEGFLDTGQVSKEDVLFRRSDYGPSGGTGIIKLDPEDTVYTFQEMLSKTLQYSDDVGYAILRQRFGMDCERSWLEAAGVSTSIADYSYPMYTVKDLAKMWIHMNTYFQNGQNGEWLKELYTRAESSTIRMKLGEKYTVYSKPGFNETPDGNPVSNAFDDAGIVDDGENPYILVIMTDGKGWDNATESAATPEVQGNTRRLMNLVGILDEIHQEMTEEP